MHIYTHLHTYQTRAELTANNKHSVVGRELRKEVKGRHKLFPNVIIPNVIIPNVKIPNWTINLRKNSEKIPEASLACQGLGEGERD